LLDLSQKVFISTLKCSQVSASLQIAMYIEAVPNRNSPPFSCARAIALTARSKKCTLLNLGDWPPALTDGLRTLLKGGTALPPSQDAIIIKRALPHSHVAAVLGTVRRIGLDRLLGPVGNAVNRCRDLVIAMIVARLIGPLSKLATAKALDPITAASSLGEVLALGAVDEDELYAAHLTGCWSANRRSKPRWRGATSRTARLFFMMSRRVICIHRIAPVLRARD
jgi:hypothetical protein